MVVLISGDDDDGGDGGPGATTEATTTETTTTETTTTDSDEFSFASPTRNIVCHVTSDEATCGIIEFAFDPPPDTGNCGPERWGHTLRVGTSGEASFVCSGNPPAEPSTTDVLDYGGVVSVGSMECGADRMGVYCESRESDKGFAVSRERYGFG